MTPDQIENKFQYIEKSIKNIGNHLTDLNAIAKVVPDESPRFNIIENKVLSLEEWIKLQLEKLFSSVQYQGNSVEALQKTFEQFHLNFEEIYRRFVKLQQADDLLAMQVVDLKNRLDSLSGAVDAFDPKLNEVKVTLKAAHDAISSNAGNLQKLDRNQQSHAEAYQAHVKDISESTDKISNNLKEHVEHSSELLKQTREEVCSKFNSLSSQVNAIKDDMSAVLQIKQSEKSITQNDLNAAIDDIKSMLDASKLDVQNASLRTSNTANQVQLLEKKIENIYLLLKKIELSK